MKYLLVFIVPLFIFISCDFSDINDEKVHGNGIVQTNEYTFDGFFEVCTNGAYNLILVQDSTWDVTVEAESNILPLIEIVKQGSSLVIENEEGYEFDLSEPINVTIHHRGLEKVVLNGAGKITGENINNHINFFMSGAGEIDAEIDCYELDISASGENEITLSGIASLAHITISGMGKVFAKDLEIEKSWNTILGLAYEHLNVSEELHVDISGEGYVYYYYHDPEIDQSISGVGVIEKKE
ncbi:MAG: DUF2807 domain-containing protein [Salinivirgaceae bacterium]|nr:DUF2807 domain-containing protein [Salinivirgaceae bacterium]